jgi:hypothetical protein
LAHNRGDHTIEEDEEEIEKFSASMGQGHDEVGLFSGIMVSAIHEL